MNNSLYISDRETYQNIISCNLYLYANNGQTNFMLMGFLLISRYVLIPIFGTIVVVFSWRAQPEQILFTGYTLSHG